MGILGADEVVGRSSGVVGSLREVKEVAEVYDVVDVRGYSVERGERVLWGRGRGRERHC